MKRGVLTVSENFFCAVGKDAHNVAFEFGFNGALDGVVAENRLYDLGTARSAGVQRSDRLSEFDGFGDIFERVDGAVDGFFGELFEFVELIFEGALAEILPFDVGLLRVAVGVCPTDGGTDGADFVERQRNFLGDERIVSETVIDAVDGDALNAEIGKGVDDAVDQRFKNRRETQRGRIAY